MQHVVAVHPHVTGERVSNGVIAHVPHVQRAGGVGKHLQYVILRLGRVHFSGVERGVGFPALEPLDFDALRIVAVVVLFAFFLRHRGKFCVKDKP